MKTSKIIEGLNSIQELNAGALDDYELAIITEAIAKLSYLRQCSAVIKNDMELLQRIRAHETF